MRRSTLGFGLGGQRSLGAVWRAKRTVLTNTGSREAKGTLRCQEKGAVMPHRARGEADAWASQTTYCVAMRLTADTLSSEPYRDTLPKNKRPPPPRITTGPSAQAYSRVLGRGGFL